MSFRFLAEPVSRLCPGWPCHARHSPREWRSYLRLRNLRIGNLLNRKEKAVGLLASATTPFLPQDFATLVNPLWARGLRARVVSVTPEAAGAATLVLKPASWSGHLAGQYVGIGVE